MACVGMPANDLTARRQFEALGSAFVRLELKLHLDLSQDHPPREAGDWHLATCARLWPVSIFYVPVSIYGLLSSTRLHPPELSVDTGRFTATGMADGTAAVFVAAGIAGPFGVADRG